MKVLYVGHYRDHTGYGDASIRNILALDAAGVDVVCRSIRFNNSFLPLPKRILELEQKDEYGANICIQHTLPCYMEYDGHFDKNIGVYYSETDSFKDSGWTEKLNCMDEIWITCMQMAETAVKSGVETPFKIFPIPCDTSIYEEEYEALNIPQLDDTFVFYWIGELSHRKNLAAAILAFHLEFDVNEPVSFLIKTNKSGIGPSQCLQEVQNLSEAIKKSLKLYKEVSDYKKEVVITKHLTQKEMMQFHRTGDCLLMTSYGEAWHIPSFDALGMENLVIAHNVGPFWDNREFKSPAILVGGTKEPVISEETISGLYTANESWQRIHVHELRYQMRKVYENEMENIRKNGIDFVYNLSLESIGQKMKEVLNG